MGWEGERKGTEKGERKGWAEMGREGKEARWRERKEEGRRGSDRGNERERGGREVVAGVGGGLCVVHTDNTEEKPRIPVSIRRKGL